jgi:hypothetical protein
MVPRIRNAKATKRMTARIQGRPTHIRKNSTGAANARAIRVLLSDLREIFPGF